MIFVDVYVCSINRINMGPIQYSLHKTFYQRLKKDFRLLKFS